MALLFSLMLVFPEKGIAMGAFSLKFPTTNEFFALKTEMDSLSKDEIGVKKIFDSKKVLTAADSIIIERKLDSIRHKQEEIKQIRKTIQGNQKAMQSLIPFFAALDRANKEKVRILHYGDSQIESDRITSFLRNELQKKFGGSGAGIFPVLPVSQKWTLNNRTSGNWKRYVAYGRKDKRVKHKKYGALMSFCRFAPIEQLDSIDENTNYKGWIKIRKPKIAYKRTQKYAQVNVYLRNINYESSYKILADAVPIKSGTINPNIEFLKIQGRFNVTPAEIQIIFNGKNSPDILGISLEGNTGIVMDNIPLRGSSGTLFTRQNKNLLQQMYTSLSPKLIILEFGGNTIPYMKSIKQATNYGNWFKNQINFLKRLNPNIPILVIGPSDMSRKNKTEYVTRPFLEDVRDALQEATLSTDCLFWDMYAAMGGRNSMPKWVNAVPALGGADHIHFTSKGSVKIASMFKTELFKLYDVYKTKEKK